MQSVFERVAGWESKDVIGIKEKVETKFRGPELPQNYQRIRLTGACGRREGGKFGSSTEGANEVRWNGDEVQRKEELTQS